jgi:hypothetical protein
MGISMGAIAMTDKLTILLMTADPSDATRLRLGDELREIQLQLSKGPDRLSLEMRPSVRPSDFTQAIVDTQPQIVHFSGHGTKTGEICLQDDLGKTHAVPPDALASLFELVANQVRCVVLNACFSEPQAQAIAQHIDYVIGMSDRIGDEAAIIFSVGFYKALGAGYSIEDAYRFGLVELKLRGIPGDLIPVLVQRKADTSSQVKKRTVQISSNWEIKITVPEGFNIHESNNFLKFPTWLRNPIGRSSDATEHSIRGIVIPHDLAVAVNIQIYTDQWYPQSLCLIQEDGSFSGSVWLHHSLPSAIFRFDILDSDRKLLKRFDVNVS